MLAAIAHRDRIPVIMCNQVGGNDSLIFDGSSIAINANGDLIAQAKSFEEDLVMIDPFQAPAISDPPDDDTEAAFRALVLGTRDYVRKCGFSKALIALSGGIDSALVAAIAADALGKENVLAIGMPSPYSSQGSIDDSRVLAANPELIIVKKRHAADDSRLATTRTDSSPRSASAGRRSPTRPTRI